MVPSGLSEAARTVSTMKQSAKSALNLFQAAKAAIKDGRAWMR